MSLTITTINVNGIRAAVKKDPGLLGWLETTTADVVLLQEVRASEEQSRAALAPALEDGWQLALAPALAPTAKGRAGVAILSRRPLVDVSVGFGSFTDAGRWIEATVDDVRVASLYLPSGEVGTARQEEKYRFLGEFGPLLAERAATHPKMIVGGDWNICHRRQDLKNWKTNQKKAGFLPEERAFMDSVFTPEAPATPAWFDVARQLNPDANGPYTWWTYRGQAFNNDAGWRIDYQAATAAMMESAEETWVEKAATVEERWSDHAPLNVRYAK